MTKYSIIVPTYNERENIPILVYLINKHLKGEYIISYLEIMKLL
jgi:glycosyltransferase involved in cell wall biosynthesis